MPLEVFTSFIFKVKYDSLISWLSFQRNSISHFFFLIFCLTTSSSHVLCSLLQQEIAAAADAAVRKYNEETTDDEMSKDGVATAMRCSIKEATEKLYKKLSKIVAVANLGLGRDWLEEVQSTYR